MKTVAKVIMPSSRKRDAGEIMIRNQKSEQEKRKRKKEKEGKRGIQ